MKKTNKHYVCFLATVFLTIASTAIATLVDSSVTSYIDSHNGITVSTNTYLDNGLRIFDYLILNNSGDTFYDISTTGEDWVGGSGINLTWDLELINSSISNEDLVRFYNNSLLGGNSEEFITGSSILDSWGTRQMALKGLSGQDYDFTVLGPEIEIPEPATFTLVILGSLAFLRRRL